MDKKLIIGLIVLIVIVLIVAYLMYDPMPAGIVGEYNNGVNVVKENGKYFLVLGNGDKSEIKYVDGKVVIVSVDPNVSGAVYADGVFSLPNGVKWGKK